MGLTKRQQRQQRWFQPVTLLELPQQQQHQLPQQQELWPLALQGLTGRQIGMVLKLKLMMKR